ncbi:hypothetical protein BT96DRAFT_12444 [Gymnopus androsaceus JB14]|uniref:Uncharacterized protein n=1 Tax=Gymnopus androsaceus JB14 TaxID=1447944 RepID=A0A6A4IS73_9AGAR|nr:hypothetical protein BT96DRAFT_12444 [Gymnopus androsaceus JB14]
MEDAVNRNSRDALGTIVLKHTFKKFNANLTKRDKTWDKRVRAIRSQLAENPVFLGLFEMIIRSVNVTYNLASVYANRGEADNEMGLLIPLWMCLESLDEMVRRSKDKDKIIAMLDLVDYGRDGNISDVIEFEEDDDSDYEEDEEDGDDDTLRAGDTNTLQEGFSMTRYIYRIIAIIIHTRRLLRIAVSPAYNKFIDKEFNIHPCPKMLQKIYVDPQKLLESTKLPV